jgi:4-amino-4-deoxy-L-arabinose transferase-like glycosyltransferase
MTEARERGVTTALVVLGVAIKLALAVRCALLADEAYFWLWSRQLALGYYDQPPLIAWMIRLGTTVFGDTELGVRAPAVLCTLAIVPLLWQVRHPVRLAVGWLAIPLLSWWTGFSTPDAPLLGWWAIGLAGALAGGSGWWVAGVAAGMAFESKHTGAALLPLAILGAGRPEWRDRRVWGAVVVAAALAAPNLWWNAQHDWVTVRFQLREGLAAGAPPGVLGALGWLGGQFAITAGLTVAMIGWTWGLDLHDRSSRILAATSLPLLLGFFVASWLSPAEVYWPAIAWVAVLVAVCDRVGPRTARAVDVSLGVALVAQAIAVLHARTPLWQLPDDPASRLTEGPLVAEFVGAWAKPAASERRAPWPVLTERYQEAAWIAFYAGVPAWRWPGCGRADQFTVWGAPPVPAEGLFIRPFDASSHTCVDDAYPKREALPPLKARDLAGRHVGDWEAYLLRPVSDLDAAGGAGAR